MLNAPLIFLDVKLLNPEDYNVPTGMTLFAQLLFCSFIEDILFYFGHSTLHKPFFYKHIHKYHHEHKQTTSISCIHAHPIEFTFGNAVPSLIGSMILGKRMHISSQYAFGIIRYINSIDEHCGYKFPWSMQRILPFHFNQDEHFYHHSENVGSYGSFFEIWDNVFGSNTAFFSQLK